MKISKGNYGLYLVPFGSRTMLASSACIDYDYAAQDSDTSREILLYNGFKEFDVGKYADTQTTGIFKKGNVDVILKKDILFFEEVWEGISLEFYNTFLCKRSPIYSGLSKGQISNHIRIAMNQLFETASAMESSVEDRLL